MDAPLAEGNTPLHDAAMRGDRRAVGALLEAGADPNARCAKGCTPLHRALEGKHLQVARMLLAAGCSLDATDSQGVKARDLAQGVPLWETEA